MTMSLHNINRLSRACILIACTLLTLSLNTHSRAAEKKAAFFEHDPVPGGIAVVALYVSASESAPVVKFGKREVAVVSDNGQWHAIVGLALSTEPGQHSLKMTSAGNNVTVDFNVSGKKYEEQRIVLKDNSKVTPAPLDLERIKKENVRIREVKAYRYKTLLSESFKLPVEGILTSPFGLRRFYNDKPRRPHGGIDIAGATGTPIYAPATGLVVDTGDYFFNGNTIFIEHGLGLQTFYAHLDKIHVVAGDKVNQGDLIGEIGATGRVTGPHLHWSVGLNGTWVNPWLVLAD